MLHGLYEATQETTKLIPAEDSFILVDEGQLEADSLVAPRRCIPFLEKDACYWGKPPDDATAIGEIERLRESGASFMVFAWPTFWWLDYYSGLSQYLRAKFTCVCQDDRLIIFDLKGRDQARNSKAA